jgi:hypothetical protein
MSATLQDSPARGTLLWDSHRTADELGVSLRTLWTITAPRGDLRCVRLGPTKRILKYDPDVVREYIKNRGESAE